MKPAVRWLLLVALVVTMLPLAAMPALGEECTGPSVTPAPVPGNPKLCEGGLRVDPVESGETVIPWVIKDGEGNDVPITVKINVYMTDEGEKFDFEVIGAVAYKVVAKGGREGAYVYDYTPDGVAKDCGLYAPMNPSGKYADLSHIDFCFGYDPTITKKGALSGSKWYDVNKDGVWDKTVGSAEVPLEGWLITLFKDVDGSWVYVDHKMTDAAGAYTFANLDPGTYKVEEGTASGKWVQTWPLDPNYYGGLVITAAGEVYEELDFGNVCVSDAKGYTMGFWSNKNGKAAMDAYLAGGGTFPHDWTSSSIQGLFREAAKAVDMCVMLKAQYVAHWLNMNVPVGGKVADYSGVTVIIDGEFVDYDAFLADFDIHDCADYTRAEAEMYKDFFDGLNNNYWDLVYLTPCPVPTIW